MKFTKQQYVFIFLSLITMFLGLHYTIVESAADIACYQQTFGHAIRFRTFDKILSWSSLLGVFLMTATRAKVSVWACIFFYLLMLIPLLIRMQIYNCAN
jgi:hypothetical protein